MNAVLEYRVVIAVGDPDELLAKKRIIDEEITPLLKERTGWIVAGATILTSPSAG